MVQALFLPPPNPFPVSKMSGEPTGAGKGPLVAKMRKQKRMNAKKDNIKVRFHGTAGDARCLHIVVLIMDHGTPPAVTW